MLTHQKVSLQIMSMQPNIQSFNHLWIAPESGKINQVLIVMHGLGDSIQGYTWLPYEIPLKDTGYLLLNAPDDYYGGYSWFNFPEPMAPGIIRSRKLLFQLVEELEKQDIASTQIYWFGFSQGCLMALDIALRYPKVFGGVVGVSGYLGLEHEYPQALSPVAKEQSLFITHGIADPLIPEVASAKQYMRLREMGILLEYKTYPKVHTILPNEITAVHTWLQNKMQLQNGR